MPRRAATAAAVSPEPAQPATAPAADADGNYHFRIELPDVPQRDVDALATELGLLGTISQESLADKRVVFTLITRESQDDIVAICSFVLDPDDLKITGSGARQRASPAQPAEDAGYGIFESEKAEPPAVAAATAVPAEVERGRRACCRSQESGPPCHRQGRQLARSPRRFAWASKKSIN